MALFVPLDASYAQDPKILDLDDERSELLFIRSLAYCKAHLTDGMIHRRALHQLAPFAGEVHGEDLAADLVRTGLWTETDRGWLVTAWLKRNPSSEEILTPNRGRELAHQRHHVNKGVQKQGCQFCFPVEDPQVTAHDAVRMPYDDAVRDAQHAMPEPYPEPESEPEPTPAKSQDYSQPATPAEPTAADQQKQLKTAALVSRTIEPPAGANPDAYAAGIAREINTGPDPTRRDEIARRLAAGDTPEQIAATWTETDEWTRPTVSPEAVQEAAERARNLERATADRLARQRAEKPVADPHQAITEARTRIGATP